jgi:hypothetical protein
MPHPGRISSLLVFALGAATLTACLAEDATDDEVVAEQEVNTGYTYVGVFSGYPTYCGSLQSIQGCRGFQSKSGPRYTDSRGNSCRDLLHRDGGARYATGTFSATTAWYKTHVIDCR